MNEHLQNHKGPLPEIILDLASWSPVGGRSGYVPKGNYEMETVAVEVIGKNVRWTDQVVGPTGDGTVVYTYHPAPFGEPGSKQLQNGTSFMGSRLATYFAHKGEDPEKFKKNGVKIPGEKYFVGKRFFALLGPGGKTIDGETGEEKDFSDCAQIDRYLTSRAQYEAKPGAFETPEGGGRRRTSKSAQALDQGGPNGAPAKPAATSGAEFIDLGV